MLIFIKLSVIIMSVNMSSKTILIVIMLSIVLLIDVVLNFILLAFIMLIVTMPNVILTSVMAPLNAPNFNYLSFFRENEMKFSLNRTSFSTVNPFTTVICNFVTVGYFRPSLMFSNFHHCFLSGN